MNYKDIITKVAKTLDPDKTINVTVINDTDMGEAHFVVADIEYVGDSDLRIPFVIYNYGNVFMPRDWQSRELPETADRIENTDWVTYPNRYNTIIVDRLPRTVMGNF